MSSHRGSGLGKLPILQPKKGLWRLGKEDETLRLAETRVKGAIYVNGTLQRGKKAKPRWRIGLRPARRNGWCPYSSI